MSINEMNHETIKLLNDTNIFPFIIIPDIEDLQEIFVVMKIPVKKTKNDNISYHLAYTMSSRQNKKDGKTWINLLCESPSNTENTNGFSITHDYDVISKFYNDVNAAEELVSQEVTKKIREKNTSKNLKNFIDFYEKNFKQPIICEDLYNIWIANNKEAKV